MDLTTWTGRRISHPDNSPSRRTQSWSYQISGDSLEQIARERLAAGNTTGNTSETATTNSPLASISNSTNGGRTVHHSIHVPERSFPGKLIKKSFWSSWIMMIFLQRNDVLLNKTFQVAGNQSRILNSLAKEMLLVTILVPLRVFQKIPLLILKSQQHQVQQRWNPLARKLLIMKRRWVTTCKLKQQNFAVCQRKQTNIHWYTDVISRWISLIYSPKLW